MMKGLEIAEKYYRDYGVPMIEQKFGNYKEKIAAGLVGEGSQCYGFDDELLHNVIPFIDLSLLCYQLPLSDLSCLILLTRNIRICG